LALSLIPLKFPIIRIRMRAIPHRTLWSCMAGKIDEMAASPAATDTATVST